MEQSDPDHNSNPGGSTLRSPFDYQHQNHTEQVRKASLSGTPGLDQHTLDSDPDAFYRPFSDRRTDLPDICVEGDQGLMSVSKKKHGYLNGVSAVKPDLSGSITSRTFLRSVSSPAGTSSTAGPKSPAVPTRTGLIKERVKQFDQSNTSNPSHLSSRPPPVSKTLTGRTPPRAASNDKTARKGTSSSPRKREQNGNARRPLFGEVMVVTAGAEDAGYGIPTLSRQRSNLETSLPRSSVLSSQTRSNSHLDALSPQPSLKEPLSPTSERLEPKAFSPAGPNSASLTPSRIPVRARRASDIGPAVAGSKLQPKDHTLSSRSFGQGPRARPITPVALSGRRYSPKRNVDTGQTLTVDIREPLPKLSPPLRSSRPRQPVSAATTGPSRSKIADRLNKLSTAEVSSSKGPPKDFVNVDVASRRSQVHSNLSRTYIDSPTTDSRQDFPSRKNSAQLEEADAQDGASREGLSPLIEQASPLISQAVQQPEVDANIAAGQTKVSSPAPSPPRAKDSLFRQVLSLRDDSPISPETEIPEDLLSERGDAETINIVLGETPKLPFENFAEPIPYTIHDRDEDELNFADGRTSIYPDDSVSVIFYQQRDRADAKRAAQLEASNAQRTGIFTLDSEARSQINHVLEQYQEGHVTPQMAHQFQREVEKLTPDTTPHNDWQSPEATKHYLCSVLDCSIHGLTTPSTVSAVEPRRVSEPTIEHESRRESQPVSIREGPIDQEYRGSAVIYANQRPFNPTTKQEPQPRPPSKSWRNTSDSLALSVDQFSRRTSASQVASTALTSPPDGLGLSIDGARPDSPLKSPVPPAPIHAPPPPPDLIGSRDALVQSPADEDIISSPIKKASWPGPHLQGLPSSPAPVGRRRRETAEDKIVNSDKKRDSNLSRPSIDIAPGASPASFGSANSAMPPVMKRASTSSVSSEEKRLKERWNIMKELVDTEHSYYHDMTIGVDIFMATAPSVASLTPDDRRLIFGNIGKIRDLASQFLEALKKSVYTVYQIPQENRFHFKRGSAEPANSSETTTNTSSLGAPPDKEIHKVLDEQTTVGQTFLDFAEKMEHAYEEWMTHHDVSNRRIEAVKNDPHVKMWLEECYENAKDITNAWSLDSLLVKPTQRYMKYPLLLGGLKKCTPADHPDHESLIAADSWILESTMRINEAKRRKDVIGQELQKKHSKQKQSQNNRLNVRKMLNFRGGGGNKYGGRQGVSNGSPEDHSYDAIVQKFGGHFFQLQIVMRDFEKYCEDSAGFLVHLDQYILALEGSYRSDPFCRWPEPESRIHQYHEAVASIQRHALPEHVRAVQRFVIDPVRKLWRLHDNPQHLMAKRKKLLPVYNKYMALKSKRDKKMEALKVEAEQWIAINDVLKLELPELYRLTREVVQACLRNFISIQSQWETMWMHKLKQFVDEDDMDFFFEMNITEFFHLVREEFENEHDPIESDLQTMALTSRTIIDDMDVNFLMKMPEPNDGVDDSSASSNPRPSTVSSGKRTLTGTDNSARPSTEQTGRNATYFTMGTPQSGTMSSHRLSASGGALSPDPASFYAQTDSLYSPYHFYSAQNSAGPATPNAAMASGQQTPSGQFPASKPNWFHSEWADSDAVISPQGLNGNDLQRLGRGYDAIAGRQTTSSEVQRDQHGRYSGIFHSALPADLNDDDEVLGLTGPPPADDGDPRVLFVVASLFEFNIDSNRREAGYPYLKYVAGEVFDILGQRGELWLARNQDDSDGTLGWIWEKHFALLPSDSQ